MAQYPNTEPEDGYYEIHLGFFWSDDREEGPQSITVDFQLTEEMEEDYPGKEAEEDHGFANAERMREDWVQHHISMLLDRGFVVDIYGHDDIQSIEDFKENMENISFNAYYT